MVRIEVMAYTPTDLLEEHDATVGRCRELVDKYSVTWVNIVDPDGRTLEELETLFGFHPLALEDAMIQDLAPKVEIYDDVAFIVARTIVWAEEIETDQLSIFQAKKFVVTIHDKVFPQLEDIRIRLRKKTPRLLKAAADYLAYTILDIIVDSYFPHLDRFQTIMDELEEEIVERPTGKGIARLHDLRKDLLLVRNSLRPQRDVLGTLTRVDVPVFRKEMRNYFRDVQDHMINALDTLDTYREIMTGLMEIQATLVSNQLNQVIKVLTVIFTITIPATIVTSAFGMNVIFPGYLAESGFYLAIAVIAVPTFAIIYWLRKKAFL